MLSLHWCSCLAATSALLFSFQGWVFGGLHESSEAEYASLDKLICWV
ncbi:hypothetical protein OROMI_006437 [Orobanche minor]